MEVNDWHSNFSLFLCFFRSTYGVEEKGKALSVWGLPVKQRADRLKCTSENRK